MNNLRTLSAVLPFAHGRTIGGEPAFLFPEIFDVLALCTKHGVAVLGIELFKVDPDGYSTEGISDYEVLLRNQSWHEFVLKNNSLASDFATMNPAGDDHFYLLTASLESEYPDLASASSTL